MQKRHTHYIYILHIYIAAQMVRKRVLRMHTFACVLKQFERGPAGKVGTMNRISD